MMLVLGLPLSASAIEVSSDTSALVGLSVCTDSTCQSKYPRYAFDQEGFPGAQAASAAISSSQGGQPASANSGTASATIGTAAADGAPVLTAYATGTSGLRNLATAAALQSYTWNGTGPASRAFGGVLTYSQTITGAYAQDNFSGISASVDVFTLPTGALFDAGTAPIDNLNALLDDAAQPGYQEVATASFTDPNNNAAGRAFLSATIAQMQPGQTYWVLTVLQAPGDNGGTTDASHTLVTSWFDGDGTLDTAGLVAAPAVPIPPSFGLLLAGLALLGICHLLRRRHGSESSGDRTARAFGLS
jgi:hypothetical protein